MKTIIKILLITLFIGVMSCNKEDVRQDTFGFNTDVRIKPINQDHNIKWITADDLTFSVVASTTYILIDWEYYNDIVSGFEVVQQTSYQFSLIPLSDNQYNLKWKGKDNIFESIDLFE